MATMTNSTMELSQVISGPTDPLGQTFAFVFCSDQDYSNLKKKEISVIPLSWLDYFW